MTIIPTVIVDLILGPLIRPEFVELSLQTAFSCQFNIAESEYYDVHWYINEQTVTTFKNVLIDNIEDTNLTESVWVGKYRLNMVVSYIMRLCYTYRKDNYLIAENIHIRVFFYLVIKKGQPLNYRFLTFNRHIQVC